MSERARDRTRVLRRIGWGLALLILVFGILTKDPRNTKWMILGIGFYAVPLIGQILGQLLRRPSIKVWSIWFGVFMVVQTVLSPRLIGDYRHLPPNMDFVFDVQGGIPGISGRQRYTTDEMGYRVTKDIDYAKDEGYRIFAIGASTTEQSYIDDRSTWTHLLQQRIEAAGHPDAEVINTGLSGTRARHHLATLERILEYHPDFAVFLLGINDWNWHIRAGTETQPPWWEDLALRFSNTLLGHMVEAVFVLAKGAATAGGPDEVIAEHGEFYAMRRGSLQRATKHTLRPDEVHPEYHEQLVKIAEVCKREALPCMFITQPTVYHPEAPQEVRDGLWMTPPDADFTLDFDSMVHISALYNAHLRAFGEEHGIPVCDPVPHMPPTYDAFVDDCHYNLAGAAIMGRVIGDCVAARLAR